MDAKFEHGLALIRQGLAILEKSSKGEPVGSMIMSPRVAKLGRIAHLHLQAFEEGGDLTLGSRGRSAGTSGVRRFDRRRTCSERVTAVRSSIGRPRPEGGPKTPTPSG